MTFEEYCSEQKQSVCPNFNLIAEEYSKMKAEQSARRAAEYVHKNWCTEEGDRFYANDPIINAAIQHAILEGENEHNR